MKKVYAVDLLNRTPNGTQVEFYGWVKARRRHNRVVFLDVCDSTGTIQSVVEKTSSDLFDLARRISQETAVKIAGILVETGRSNTPKEIRAQGIEIFGSSTINVSPYPRSDIDIQDPRLQEQLLNKRHFYLRNEKIGSGVTSRFKSADETKGYPDRSLTFLANYGFSIDEWKRLKGWSQERGIALSKDALQYFDDRVFKKHGEWDTFEPESNKMPLFAASLPFVGIADERIAQKMLWEKYRLDIESEAEGQGEAVRKIVSESDSLLQLNLRQAASEELHRRSTGLEFERLDQVMGATRKTLERLNNEAMPKLLRETPETFRTLPEFL